MGPFISGCSVSAASAGRLQYGRRESVLSIYDSLAERSKAPDSSSGGAILVGSNPTAVTLLPEWASTSSGTGIATCAYLDAHLTKGLWRNGSASDSRSDGWAFESLWPQLFTAPPSRARTPQKWHRHSRHVRDSIVVSISACHADDPGSIPGRGDFYVHLQHEAHHFVTGCVRQPFTHVRYSLAG